MTPLVVIAALVLLAAVYGLGRTAPARRRERTHRRAEKAIDRVYRQWNIR